MLKEGIKGTRTLKVTYKDTAAALGNGEIEVFSTPHMINMIETTCKMSLNEYLDESKGTVGTQLNVKHLAATPIGMTVTCETELVKVDGNRLEFRVSCHDDLDLIGEGTHERYIIDNEKFMSRVNKKIEKMKEVL